MAIQAVINEQLGTVLQGCQIIGFNGGFVPSDAVGRSLHATDQAQGQSQTCGQFFHHFHFLDSPGLSAPQK
jgi:hypothetical protein